LYIPYGCTQITRIFFIVRFKIECLVTDYLKHATNNFTWITVGAWTHIFLCALVLFCFRPAKKISAPAITSLVFFRLQEDGEGWGKNNRVSNRMWRGQPRYSCRTYATTLLIKLEIAIFNEYRIGRYSPSGEISFRTFPTARRAASPFFDAAVAVRCTLHGP